MIYRFDWFKKTPSFIIFLFLCIPFFLSVNINGGKAIAFFVITIWLTLIVLTTKQHVDGIQNLSYLPFYFSISFSFCYIAFCDLYFGMNLPVNIAPFHIAAMLCLIYSFFFTARLIVVAEEQKTVKANRCIGTLFLLWFFPIGVWFIHNRIKKIV